MKDQRAPRTSATPAPNLGLRARNKQRTMREIQNVALDLFDEHGFTAVTVEQIATSAGVSPATIYRYFGTKERLILHDEDDRMVAELVVAAIDDGASILSAAKETLTAMVPILRENEPLMRRRARYMSSEPTVWAAMILEARAALGHIAFEIARKHGQDKPGLDVLVPISAIAAAIVAAMEAQRWEESSEPIDQVVARCFDMLETGLDGCSSSSTESTSHIGDDLP